MLAAAGKNGLPGGGMGGGAVKEAEKDALKFAPATPLLAGGAVPAIVAATILGGGAAAGAERAPVVDDYGRVTGNWGGDPDHLFGFKEGNAMLRRRKARSPQGAMARPLALGRLAAGRACHRRRRRLTPVSASDLDLRRPGGLSAPSMPAVLPVPLASLPARALLPPATAAAPVPVHVVSTAANIPLSPMGPGMHRDFTLGNRLGDFASPGLGAGSGFSPFPGHRAPSVDAVQGPRDVA